MSSLKLENGYVVDGSGQPMFKGNVVVGGDRIIDVSGSDLGVAEETVNISGLILSPGFIDMHSHSDLSLLKNPHAESMIRQGVTTEVIGNCGISVAPVEDETKSQLLGYASPLLGVEDIPVAWRGFGEYLSYMEKAGSALNVTPLVGHGTIRIAVMGFDDREPSQEELQGMRDLVGKAMEEGAFGMSSGLIYPPGCYARTPELVELCKVVAGLGGIYSTHIRGEGKTLLDAVKEAIETGQEAGVSVEVSHHKAAGEHVWGMVETTLEMMDEARREGADINCDNYPYTAGWTKLTAVLPDWVKVGGVGDLIKRLRDDEVRERLRREIEGGLPGWSSYYKASGGWDGIMICQTRGNTALEGKTISEVAKERGADPYDVLFDLLVEEEAAPRAVFFMMSEDDVIKVFKHPSTMIGSDGIAVSPGGELGRGNPHPRFYGTFPRVIARYVREKAILSLEEAVRKMTSLPAGKLGLNGRGRIVSGAKADLVIFDYKKIKDRATYQDPHQFPEGIVHVIVNGEFVVREGEQNRRLPGRILRKNR